MSELNKISLRERIRLNLVASMERAGINQVQLADKLGLKKGTINNWVKGNNSPDIDMVPKICSVLGISVLDYYSPTPYETVEIPKVSPPFFSILDKQILERYHALDSHGKEMVDLVIDKETERMELEANAREDAQEAGGDVVYVTQYYCRPMSAGTGQEAGDDAPESLHLKKEPPPGTSYVAPVSGDSMEPTYYNGDLLFIRYQEEIYPGQIGVFFMDGQQWIKELGDGVLISHNPEYAPRPITEDIRCQGRVLGVCDESYFE